MARYLWQSFVETIAPDAEQPAQKPSKPLSHTIGDEPLNSKGEREVNLGPASKAALEHKKPAVVGAKLDEDDDLGEIVIMPLQDLVSQIAIQKTGPAPDVHQQAYMHPEVPQGIDEEDPGDDILRDDKLYQDAVIEYCNAYQALEQKYWAGMAHGRGLWSPYSCRSSSLPEACWHPIGCQ